MRFDILLNSLVLHPLLVTDDFNGFGHTGEVSSHLNIGYNIA